MPITYAKRERLRIRTEKSARSLSVGTTIVLRRVDNGWKAELTEPGHSEIVSAKSLNVLLALGKVTNLEESLCIYNREKKP